jgi:hypothetical protein
MEEKRLLKVSERNTKNTAIRYQSSFLGFKKNQAGKQYSLATLYKTLENEKVNNIWSIYSYL